MKSFSSIKELFSLLSREQKLLTELFQKRASLDYRYEYALALSDNDADKITALIDYGVVRQNGANLELEDQFLQFFEQVLEVNELINVSFIEETLAETQRRMSYYLQESNEARRYNILRQIKAGLRKTGTVALRNVLDLSRNIENTYKGEPNFKVKRSKLEYLDTRRRDILTLIERTENLVSGNEEATFFKIATDDGLSQIIIALRHQLNDCRHNLVDIQKQIIEYLNRIRHQSTVAEKLKQLKYLKDQFEIKHKTNITQVLSGRHDVIFEPQSNFSTKLSLPALSLNYEAAELIRKVAKRKGGLQKRPAELADAISEEYLSAQVEEEVQVNLEELINSFLATSYSLFPFIRQYPFPKMLSFDEQVTVFCQIVSHYEEQLSITGDFGREADIEYAIVHPK